MAVEPDAGVARTQNSPPALSAEQFRQRLSLALDVAVQDSHELSLLCADIDRLRTINTEAGATVGDALLRALGEAFIAALGRRGGECILGRHANGRILGVLPACRAQEAQEVANTVRETFEASSLARQHVATCSVGVVTHAPHRPAKPQRALRLYVGSRGAAQRHARSAEDLAARLTVLCEEALQRAKRLGRNQVAELLPAILLVGNVPLLRKATRGLLSRIDVLVRTCERPDDLASSMRREVPSVLVMDLLGPRLLLDTIAELRRTPAHASMEVVLVTEKGPGASYEAKAARIPGAALVMGPVRTLPRLLEAVSAALGIKPRFHVRADTQIPITLQPAEGGPPISGTLLNVSETGAKARLQEGVTIGDVVTLSGRLDSEEFALAGSVIRVHDGPQGPEVGLKFDEPAATPSSTPADLVRRARHAPPSKAPKPPKGRKGPDIEPGRLYGRWDVPPALRLKVRVRPRHSRATSYLRIQNLSEGGFLAVTAAKVNPVVKHGEQVDALILGAGVSIPCTAEVVRKEQEDVELGWALAFKFLNLTRVARTSLSRTLYRLNGSKARAAT
jgi:GGDEF domain-containing protein/c-di-GMP-binding flagellar brake protein YcgR